MKFSVLYLKKDGIPTNKCNDGEFQHICNAHIVRQIIQLMTAAIDISFAVNFFNKNISLLTNRSLYKKHAQQHNNSLYARNERSSSIAMHR